MWLRLGLLTICAVAQGGVYHGRPRAVGSPEVSAAQWFLQEELLAVEAQVLSGSVDVARLAESITQRAYQLTDDMEDRVEAINSSLYTEAKRVKPMTPNCAMNPEKLGKTAQLLDSVTEEFYKCSHSLCDLAAGFEVEMTVLLSNARNQVWDVQLAMGYCHKYQPQVDVSCLKRLTVEGLQVIDKLPERVNTVLDKAQAQSVQSHAQLDQCFGRFLSKAEEIHLRLSQRMRKCVETVREGQLGFKLEDLEREEESTNLVVKRRNVEGKRRGWGGKKKGGKRNKKE